MNYVFFIFYVCAGLGFFGAYRNLYPAGRALFGALFPLHWLLLVVLPALAKTLAADTRWLQLPLALGILVVLTWLCQGVTGDVVSCLIVLSPALVWLFRRWW